MEKTPFALAEVSFS